MKMIKHCALHAINDKNKHFILINTLSASSSIVSQSEKEILDNWILGEKIIPKSDEEHKLFNELFDNCFLIENDADEQNIIAQKLHYLRCNHENCKKKDLRIVFILTYGCNFDCPYCYEKGQVEHLHKKLTKDQVDQVFALYGQKMKTIDLFGGEPLLPGNRDIIKYIFSKAPEKEYVITTNGYYLSEYIPVLNKVNIKHIMVTLDGTEEKHNCTRFLRGGGKTYEKIMEGIKLCLKEKIHISIRMNISEENVEDCILNREKLKEEFKEEYENGYLAFELQPLFQLDDDVKNKLMDQTLYSHIGTNENIYQMNTLSFSAFPLLNNIINSRKESSGKYCHCDAEETKRFFDPDGRIYSCVLSVGKKNASIGDYYPDFKLKENSMINRNIENIEECKECIYRFLCGGGCANEIIDVEGNSYHPNCTYMETQIKQMVTFLNEKLSKRTE